MITTLPRCSLLAAGACLFATAASAASYTITTFSVSGAKQTNPEAINDSGTVVGYWDDSTYTPHGFSYAGGTLTTFDPPGAVSSYAEGINADGTIVGTYLDKAGNTHGYIDKAGKFKQVDVTGSPFTGLTAINDKGAALGAAEGPDDGSELFIDAHGKFTVIVPDTLNPVPVALARDGTATGWYPADPRYETAFRVTAGTVTAITPPNGVFYTQPFAINRHDVIVGQAALTTGEQEGFIWTKNGKVKLLQVPGSNDSFLQGINDSGVMVGSSYDSAGEASAFVYANGSFTTLNVTGQGVQETHGISLNNAGTVLGDYVDSAGTHGFVAVPSP